MADIIDRNFQTIINRWTDAASRSASARGLTQPSEALVGIIVTTIWTTAIAPVFRTPPRSQR